MSGSAQTASEQTAEAPASGTAGPVLRWYSSEWWSALVEMYATFEPKFVYLGLPPLSLDAIERWLRGLIADPANTHLVLTEGDRVIGHAALVYYPESPEAQEIVIFVHQDYQRRGLGRRLFLAAMHRGCRHLGLDRVWLWVNRRNRKGLRLYTDVGFVPTPDSMLQPEIAMNREMTCDECLEEDCPIFTSDLAWHLYPSTLRLHSRAGERASPA